MRNDSSYYLVINFVISCASLRGGKHAEHLISFRVALAPRGGISNEHLPVDVSSGNTGWTGYYAEEDVPVLGKLDACASVDAGNGERVS